MTDFLLWTMVPRDAPKVQKWIPGVAKWRQQASQMTASSNRNELKGASGKGRSS